MTSAAMGAVLLKIVGFVTFKHTYLYCALSAVSLRLLSDVSRGIDFSPVTGYISTAFEAPPEKINFYPSPVEDQGSVGVYPVLKGEIREEFRSRLSGMTHESEDFKKLMVQLLKKHIENPSIYSKIIFDKVKGKDQLITNLQAVIDQDAQRETLFNEFVGTKEVFDAYLSAVSNDNYYFSNEEIEFMGKPAAKVAPIINRGSDCFMNALLQVIFHDEPLKQALLVTYEHINTPQARDLCAAIRSYDEGHLISTYPLRQFMLPGQQIGQRDASDFFHRLMNEVDSKRFPDLFQKETTTYYWVNGDNRKESMVVAPELDTFIEIPYNEKAISGLELIQNHFAKKKHDSEDGWIDDETKIKYTEGQEQVSIEGKRITLVLKRFNFQLNAKICTKVDMPQELELSGKKYHLKKVVTHHGSTMVFGHYTSLLHIEGKWIKADDQKISEAEGVSEDILNGYIYFYEEEASK